jgi:hypothetical protein
MQNRIADILSASERSSLNRRAESYFRKRSRYALRRTGCPRSVIIATLVGKLTV